MTKYSDKLIEDMNSFMKSSVLGAMAELDMATHLLKYGNLLTSSKLAQIMECDLRGCEVLLNALCAMEYFEKQSINNDAFYSVKSEYTNILDSGSPMTMIPLLRHESVLQRSWARLAWSVKNGKPQERIASILGLKQDRISFIMAMNSIAIKFIPKVMDPLEREGIITGERINLLDLGGASGTYTEAFLKRSPKSTATIFDLPVGIEQAKKRFYGTDLINRIVLHSGDFTNEELPTDFDMAWLSAIIHQMNRKEARILYSKVFKSLKPGGLIVIRDYVMNNEHTFPLNGSLFAINMLLQTNTGMVYSYDEIYEDLSFASFENIKQVVHSDDMCSIIYARRPFI